MKKLTLLLICIFILTGCQNQSVLPGDETPVDSSAEIDVTGFQKEMNSQHPSRLSAVCKTEVGYYLHYDGLLYFLDGTTGNMTAVCAKPECDHTYIDCNAWINSGMISYYQGKLYYVNSDAKSDSMKTLYSVELDGTNHTKIQRLQLEYAEYRLVLADPILVNGYLYFLEGDTQIYTVRLGEDVSKAVLLFEDDMTHTLESSWKFWADGGEIYAMNHILDDAGYYQDILYRLGLTEADTRMIWRSTELDISARDPSWYITDGHLYYYSPGNDLWDIELETDNAEKMIALTDTIKSETALFTDSYVLFESGKGITVYDYSGNILGEVNLSSIFEKYSDAVRSSPVFADGNCVYLLVYRRTDNSASTLFYQVAWDKGSVYEVTNWPGANVKYDNTPSEIWQIG